MLYILRMSYSPNSAATNRALAFIKNFSKLGIESKVVFFLPDQNYSKVEENYPHIQFEYYWEKKYIDYKLIRYISYNYYITNFKRQLKEGDIVLLLGMTDIVGRFSNIKGVQVYLELTEHPDVVRMWTPVNIFAKFTLAKCCAKIAGVFVISKSLQDYFVTHGVNKKNVHIINMIVDPSRFKDVKKDETQNPYIAYCGTAYNDKDGVDDLIKAFAIIAPFYPNLKLKIIGNIPRMEDRNKDIELISLNALDDRVELMGKVPADHIPDLLINAQILALARPNNLQAQNGFPTKLGEYLLTRNPVIVTRVGDIPLFLKDKESALIAEPNNPKDFARCIEWALENESKAIDIGEAGYRIAMKDFNAFNETQKILNIFLEDKLKSQN